MESKALLFGVNIQRSKGLAHLLGQVNGKRTMEGWTGTHGTGVD